MAAVVRVSRGDSDAHEREQEILSSTHLPWRLAPRGPQSTPGEVATVRCHQLGAARLVECVASPASGHRGPAEIARTDGDWVVALVNLSGTELFRQGDCNVESHPGCVVVWHSSAPADFSITRTQHKHSVFFPRTMVSGLHLPLDTGSAIALDAGQTAVGLFRSVTADVLRTVDRLDDDTRVASSRALLELLVACLRPHQPMGRVALQAGLFVRARRHIDHHLADPALRPARIAEDLRVPLRTLQDVFARRQLTIAGSILELRLARSHDDLQRAGDATITEIAFANGFTNAAHFSRRFRQRYGVAPREFRSLARGGEPSEWRDGSQSHSRQARSGGLYVGESVPVPASAGA